MKARQAAGSPSGLRAIPGGGSPFDAGFTDAPCFRPELSTGIDGNAATIVPPLKRPHRYEIDAKDVARLGVATPLHISTRACGPRLSRVLRISRPAPPSAGPAIPERNPVTGSR